MLLDCGLQETFFVPLEDQNPKSVVGEELAGPVGDYIYDPHACLLASGLVEDFAVQMKMQLVSLQSGYLTSNQRSCSRLISGFRVLDVLKLNVKMIERYLKKHQVGQLELKKRGPLDQEFARLSRAQRTGSNRMTLILSGTPSGLRAIACRRIEDSAGAT